MNAYKNAVQSIRDRRRAELDTGRIVLQNALRTDDALYAAYTEYQTETIKRARGETDSLDDARERYRKELARLGLTRDVIDPPCRCKACNDTGLVGGKYCACVVKSVINSDKENLALRQYDFDACAETAPSGIKKAYAIAKRYIDEFPKTEKPFMMFIGAPGVGKTMLAAATASALMERGASAVTVTAFGFVRRALDYHTQFSITGYVDRFTPMLDCDALVIDDLGTENTLKNITREYLYTVINERWVNRKNTIVTTNLAPAELLARYGESIVSRIFDKNASTVVTLSELAQNERLKKSDK